MLIRPITMTKQYCLQLHTLCYLMMISVMCELAHQAAGASVIEDYGETTTEVALGRADQL